MSDNQGIPLPHLKAWRKQAFLSQKQLATLAALSKYTVIDIEVCRNKGARQTTIHKLAHALDITPQQLVDGPEEGKP